MMPAIIWLQKAEYVYCMYMQYIYQLRLLTFQTCLSISQAYVCVIADTFVQMTKDVYDQNNNLLDISFWI